MARVKRPLLDHFPYETPRPEQAEILEALEKYWNHYDVFVIVAPTACGKTGLSFSIGSWSGNASIITPTNLLVEQFAAEFEPAAGKLMRRSKYKCPRVAEGRLNCEDAAKQFGGRKVLGCSRECEYIRDLQRARARGVGVYNYYTYMAHKLFRPTLIIDEAHSTIPTIQELEARKFWRHDYKYPFNIWSYGDILNWLESLGPHRPLALEELYAELHTTAPKYIIQKTKDLWKRTTPPEIRDLLKLLPVDIRDSMPYLWPSRVKKVVLMSATISRKDIEALGLDRRRVLYLEASSPIPVSRRPIIYNPIASVNRNSLQSATKKICQFIREELLPKHSAEKGVIHATYQQARLIQEELGSMDGRILYHSKTDTADKFKAFQESSPESGRVLVASGLYEGIDLVEDLGRWQVIAKVPWQSLGDPAIKHLAETDPEAYVWNSAKVTIQACGRICRTERDYGITYILDGSFKRLYSELEKFKLTPRWWKSAISEI